MNPDIARKVSRTVNPYPSVVFLAPEGADASERAGLRPGMMGYFAGRAAPMGAVPADVVIATFYNFQPALVRSVIPEAWTLASPADILDYRLAAVDSALRRIIGDGIVDDPDVKEAAQLARAACEECRPEGRALYAGHASLSWPGEPHLELWHALSLLREYRGDGHLMALQVAGYSGCDAIAMHQAVGEVPKAFAQSRGWSAEEWASSFDSLRSRGWVDAQGVATDAGRASREGIEHQTDLLSVLPFERLGEERSLRLRELVRPMAAKIAEVLFSRIRADRTDTTIGDLT